MAQSRTAVEKKVIPETTGQRLRGTSQGLAPGFRGSPAAAGRDPSSWSRWLPKTRFNVLLSGPFFLHSAFCWPPVFLKEANKLFFNSIHFSRSPPFPDGLSRSQLPPAASDWGAPCHMCPFDHPDERGPSSEVAGSLYLHRTFSWGISGKCSPHSWKLFCSAEAWVTRRPLCMMAALPDHPKCSFPPCWPSDIESLHKYHCDTGRNLIKKKNCIKNSWVVVENIRFIPVDSDPCNRALAWARMPMFLWLPDEMSLEYIFSAAHAYVGHERESDFPTWGGSRSLCWADCCLILLLPTGPLGQPGQDDHAAALNHSHA